MSREDDPISPLIPNDMRVLSRIPTGDGAFTFTAMDRALISAVLYGPQSPLPTTHDPLSKLKATADQVSRVHQPLLAQAISSLKPNQQQELVGAYANTLQNDRGILTSAQSKLLPKEVQRLIQAGTLSEREVYGMVVLTDPDPMLPFVITTITQEITDNLIIEMLLYGNPKRAPLISFMRPEYIQPGALAVDDTSPYQEKVLTAQINRNTLRSNRDRVIKSSLLIDIVPQFKTLLESPESGPFAYAVFVKHLTDLAKTSGDPFRIIESLISYSQIPAIRRQLDMVDPPEATRDFVLSYVYLIELTDHYLARPNHPNHTIALDLIRQFCVSEERIVALVNRLVRNNMQELNVARLQNQIDNLLANPNLLFQERDLLTQVVSRMLEDEYPVAKASMQMSNVLGAIKALSFIPTSELMAGWKNEQKQTAIWLNTAEDLSVAEKTLTYVIDLLGSNKPVLKKLPQTTKLIAQELPYQLDAFKGSIVAHIEPTSSSTATLSIALTQRAAENELLNQIFHDEDFPLGVQLATLSVEIGEDQVVTVRTSPDHYIKADTDMQTALLEALGYYVLQTTEVRLAEDYSKEKPNTASTPVRTGMSAPPNTPSSEKTKTITKTSPQTWMRTLTYDNAPNLQTIVNSMSKPQLAQALEGALRDGQALSRGEITKLTARLSRKIQNMTPITEPRGYAGIILNTDKKQIEILLRGTDRVYRIFTIPHQKKQDPETTIFNFLQHNAIENKPIR